MLIDSQTFAVGLLTWEVYGDTKVGGLLWIPGHVIVGNCAKVRHAG